MRQVAVSTNDQSVGWLYSKLVAGSGIYLTLAPPASNQTVQIEWTVPAGGTLTDISALCTLQNCTVITKSVHAYVDGKFCVLFVFCQANQLLFPSAYPFVLTLPNTYRASGTMWVVGPWVAPVYGADQGLANTVPANAQLAPGAVDINMYKDYSNSPFGFTSPATTTVLFTLPYQLA